MRKINEKKRYVSFIVMFAVLALCLIPGLKAKAETWLEMYPYEETENPGCVVEYDFDSGLIRAIISTNDGMQEWNGTKEGMTQSVASMFATMNYQSIFIGKDVTHIDNRAFAPVQNPGEIIIDENNTSFKLQDGMIVNMAGDTLYAVLKSCTDANPDEITLPDTITTIASHAFDGNKNIKIVHAPKVTAIEDWAFTGSKITKLTCENLTYIGMDAFQNCEALEEVAIDTDDGVSLGDASFTGCRKLTAFPYKTSNVPMNVFSKCEALQSFTIGSDISEIGSYAFSHCASVTEMTIPSSVTNIGNSAFDSCSNLATVTFESATPPTFGDHVFTNCPSDIRIVVPAGAEEAYVGALGMDYYDNIYETGVEKYGVFINGVQFTSNKTSVDCGSGTAVYNPETKTLTLNSVTVNESTIVKTFGSWLHGGSIYSKVDLLTIIVNGTNNISADADGISTSSGASVTIKGTGKLVLDTLAVSDPQMASMYVGLGDDPTGVDGGDIIIDGPEITASREIQANRNLTIKGGSKVVTKGRLRSNNNGDIQILDGADVTAAWIDFSLPRNFSTEEVYQRDMHMVLDGGCLTLQGAVRTYGESSWTVNGILFCPNEGEERDPRGHVEIKSGTLVIEKAVDEGKVLSDCPDENIVISDTMKLDSDGSVLTVEKFQKGNFTARSGEKPKVKVTDIFTDVKEGAWYVTAVQYVYDNGIMVGTGSTFGVGNSLKREQFATTLYSMAGKPAIAADAANPFSDVSNKAGYPRDGILWAVQNGVAAGNADGTFGVGKSIQRQAVASMLYKFASLKGYDMTINENAIAGFSDVKNVQSWAETAMKWAVTQGVISGKGGNRLAPTGTASREECAQMIMKLLEKNK